uniref:Uncharacterized protein n=1 Tax=Arundo donax TaxID=35708 RepID=A0A0A9HEH1_ARUDO
MSFRSHEGFGQVAAANNNGASLPWWAAAPQLLYGEPLGQGKASAMSPEEPCREGRFQVVPGAQALLDPPVPSPPKAAQPQRVLPDVLKFSMAQGKVGKGSEHSATVALQSPFTVYNGRFELGLGQSMV